MYSRSQFQLTRNDSPRFLANSHTSDGVGDDAVPFGYDGSRGQKFHNGKENYEEIPYGPSGSWKTGDSLR